MNIEQLETINPHYPERPWLYCPKCGEKAVSCEDYEDKIYLCLMCRYEFKIGEHWIPVSKAVELIFDRIVDYINPNPGKCITCAKDVGNNICRDCFESSMMAWRESGGWYLPGKAPRITWQGRSPKRSWHKD